MYNIVRFISMKNGIGGGANNGICNKAQKPNGNKNYADENGCGACIHIWQVGWLLRFMLRHRLFKVTILRQGRGPVIPPIINRCYLL